MEKSEVGAQAQPQRDERRLSGGGDSAAGPSGAAEGMSGVRQRVPQRAYVGVALFVVLAMTVSALSGQRDAGGRIPAWQLFVTEYTAAFMILVIVPAVAVVTLRMPIDRRRWPRFVAVHALASLVCSVVVVVGFVILRKLIFAAAGKTYVFGTPGDFIYEYRKLALVYCVMATAFYVAGRPRVATSVQSRAEPSRAEPTFDIRDGAKLIRAKVGEIVCVSSAGNYVEFRLAGGQRHLARATLAGTEEALLPHGFVRTHRSWLVNPLHLRALEPEGSGDWLVILGEGTRAPLSRRFPAAVEALRLRPPG